MKLNVKNMLIVFAVVFFCANSYAALISDNDGSAFITKPEFDSRRNDFLKRMDEYNTSIGNKIEEAIAEYLAGVNVDVKETITLPLANWKKYILINGVIKPKFTYPSVNAFATIIAESDEWSGSWEMYGYGSSKIKYDQDDTAESIRPTVTNVVERTQDYTDMIWSGIMTDWIEKFNVSVSGTVIANLYAYEYLETTFKFRLARALCFAGPGYRENLNSNWDSYWKGYWGVTSTLNNYKRAWNWNDTSLGINIGNSTLFFTVEKNDKVDYEHIGNWKSANASWEVYNPTWLNTLKYSTIDNLVANNWFTISSKDSYFSAIKYNLLNSGNHSATSGTYKGHRSTRDGIGESVNTEYDNQSTNYLIPRVGLVASSVLPTDMYQGTRSLKTSIDGKQYTLPKTTLDNGFILGYAKKDDEITWKPVFSSLKSSVLGYIDDDTELVMAFATKPFADSTDTEGSIIEMKKVNGVDSTVSFPTTDERKVELVFKMPEDGFIYVKWWPDTTDYDTNNWEAELDIENCNTYKRLPKRS